MPRPYTSPTLYDDLKTVDTSYLRKNGYLKLGQRSSGAIIWSRNGIKTASISIVVNAQCEYPYLELEYNCNGNPVKYRVQLISVPSNLGKGVVWYFVCPRTGNRCRKLYLAGTRFIHRSAFEGMYQRQVFSEKNRRIVRLHDKAIRAERALEEMNSKYFRKYYRGKPTKRQLRLLQQVNDGRGLSKLEW